MEKRFGVISADGHCRLMHLPFDLWTKRLPKKFQDNGREWYRAGRHPTVGRGGPPLERRGLERRGSRCHQLLYPGWGGGGA